MKTEKKASQGGYLFLNYTGLALKFGLHNN